VDSLSVRFSAGIRGRAKGIPTNAEAASPITLAGFTLTASSTLTGASQANTSLGPEVRTLNPSASEELDTQSFTNTLGQTAQTVAEIRLFGILHLSTSLASTITVGNATANQWRFFNAATTTVMTLAPGDFVILGSQTTTGIPASGTLRYLKVLNDDATALHVASYRVFWFGSTS
jgi:hypothetical protein